MLKRKAEVFAPTDGVLSVCTDKSARMTRGADFCDPTTLESLFALSFRRMRILSRDVELSESTGAEITAKVEVRTAPSLSVDADVVMDNRVYELTHIESRGRTCWLWLSEMAKDGTCDLLQETYTYDAVGIPAATTGTPVSVYVRRVTPGAKRSKRSEGIDAMDATLTLRLRTLDYAGEQHLTYAGHTYTVMATEGHGRWVDLTCRERGADRG